MNPITASYADNLTRDSSVTSVIIVENQQPFNPLTDGYDTLMFIVVESAEPTNHTTHYIKDGSRIQERRIDRSSLEKQIAARANRNMIYWIIQGEILLDRDLYISNLREELLQYGLPMREQKLFAEFASFFRCYSHCKQFLHDGHTIDAYSNILEALHHWARIAIIETGTQPEETVWKQVKSINSGVYKLFEEMTTSVETIEQRIQLVLLACEFSIMSKMEECCTLLFRILDSRAEPWSVMELKQHPELSETHVELALILQKLVKKSLIREVAVASTNDLSRLELKYVH